MRVKGPTVNTAGLTRQRARLAIEYVGTEADALAAILAMKLAVEYATEATKRAEGAIRTATEARRAFARAVPDWKDRVTGAPLPEEEPGR